jgi:hypothetical protein
VTKQAILRQNGVDGQFGLAKLSMAERNNVDRANMRLSFTYCALGWVRQPTSIPNQHCSSN